MELHERHGLSGKRPRRGGTLFFLFAIAAVVAGAGAAGLHYRAVALGDEGTHVEQHATDPEPDFSPAPVTLTNADELAPTTEPAKTEAVADAGVKATKPTPPKPVARPRAHVKPKPAEAPKPAPSDAFANPE